MKFKLILIAVSTYILLLSYFGVLHDIVYIVNEHCFICLVFALIKVVCLGIFTLRIVNQVFMVYIEKKRSETKFFTELLILCIILITVFRLAEALIYYG